MERCSIRLPCVKCNFFFTCGHLKHKHIKLLLITLPSKHRTRCAFNFIRNNFRLCLQRLIVLNFHSLSCTEFIYNSIFSRLTNTAVSATTASAGEQGQGEGAGQNQCHQFLYNFHKTSSSVSGNMISIFSSVPPPRLFCQALSLFDAYFSFLHKTGRDFLSEHTKTRQMYFNAHLPCLNYNKAFTSVRPRPRRTPS